MFRFTIRDVFLVTVIVALAVSWRIDHQRIDKTVAAMKQQGLKDEHQAKLLREALEDEREVLRLATLKVQKQFQDRIRFSPSGAD